jgi:hypothetical protein
MKSMLEDGRQQAGRGSVAPDDDRGALSMLWGCKWQTNNWSEDALLEELSMWHESKQRMRTKAASLGFLRRFWVRVWGG